MLLLHIDRYVFLDCSQRESIFCASETKWKRRLKESFLTKVSHNCFVITKFPSLHQFSYCKRFVRFRQGWSEESKTGIVFHLPRERKAPSSISFHERRRRGWGGRREEGRETAHEGEKFARSCHRVLFLTLRVAFISFLTNSSTPCSNAHGQINVSFLYVYFELQ